jgi:hypothetical protein
VTRWCSRGALKTLLLRKENCNKNTVKVQKKFDIVIGTPWRIVGAARQVSPLLALVLCARCVLIF